MAPFHHSLFTFVITISFVVKCSAQLVGIEDTEGERIWRNDGSIGRYFLVVYEAKRKNSDEKVLGQTGQDNWRGLTGTIYSWRDESQNKDALAKPTGFKFIWDSVRGNYFETITLWRANCPKGYVALGDFFHRDVGVSKPPEELFNKARCIKETLTEECYQWGVKIWDNKGSTAKRDGAIWGIESKSTSFNTRHFYGNDSHNVRPAITPKCMKKSSILRLEK